MENVRMFGYGRHTSQSAQSHITTGRLNLPMLSLQVIDVDEVRWGNSAELHQIEQRRAASNELRGWSVTILCLMPGGDTTYGACVIHHPLVGKRLHVATSAFWF
jgi:hypothetical protein